jgi:hypothetical protein
MPLSAGTRLGPTRSSRPSSPAAWMKSTKSSIWPTSTP